MFALTESCFGVGSKYFLSAPVWRAGLDRKIGEYAPYSSPIDGNCSIRTSPDEIVGSDCINLTRKKPDSVVTERDLGFGQMVQSRPLSWQVREGYLGRGCA